MKTGAILAGLVLALTAASAQSPDPKRLSSIWEAANERIERQTEAWFKEGDFPRTVQLLRMSYSLNPADYETATNLGWMLENIEEFDQALAVYIQLRTENPKVPDCAWPEANFYFQKKAYAKVPPILEPTLGSKPHGNSFRTLAHSYEKMNMLADSKRIWERFLATKPVEQEAQVAKNNLNRVLKKLKEGFSKKS